MSLKSQAIRTIHAAQQRHGGADETRKASICRCKKFLNFCIEINQPLLNIKDASYEQVAAYIKCLINPPPGFAKKGLRVDSLHNVVSQIRVTMEGANGDPDALGITAKKLGLPPRDRKGKKLPITDDRFITAIAKAKALGEHGFEICIRLERYFGHRIQEALMSDRQIKLYLKEVMDLVRIGGVNLAAPGGCVLPELPVIDGTKGKRPRVVESIAKYALESLQALTDAVEFLKKHQYFVEVVGFIEKTGKKKGLREARAKAHRLARLCDLKGQYSPHSLRYRYACDKLEEFRDANWIERDAFLAVTKFLGHGPTRANAVARQVYGQTVANTFPKKSKKERADGELQDLLDMTKRIFMMRIAKETP